MRHSFDRIGAYKGTDVFRTIVSRGDPITDDAEFDAMKQHFDQRLNTKWIWVADCANMESTHYLSLPLMYRLYNTLHYDHADSVQYVWILNIDPWVRWILTMFLSPKVEILPTGRLELFMRLREMGCSVELESQLLATASA